MINNPINTVVCGIIRSYQKTISPDHGAISRLFPNGYCKYYPSCSEYSRQCFKKHGLVRASKLSLYRILRCNPISQGGIDEVPK
ncbi:TPA: membrane protein insertion efficiency factor YidD [Candidatus Uhrbacteria bacterium]|nr:membrane protein insertion efficiency factor YidD [Candidatus Uhrbacteria bacterium]